MATQGERDRIYEMRVVEERSWSQIYRAFPHLRREKVRQIVYRRLKRGGETSKVPKKQDSEDRPPNASPDTHQVKFDDDGREATAYSISARIKTLAQLLEAAEVDLDVWYVDHYVVNKWEIARKDQEKDLTFTDGVIDGCVRDRGGMFVQPLFQVKAWLKRRQEAEIKQLIDDMREDLRRQAPAVIYRRPPANSPHPAEHMFELSIPDLHFGMWSSGEVTGQGDYHMEEARRLFLAATCELMGYAGGAGIEKILFPLGNDLLAADNSRNETTHGTPQDTQAEHRVRFRAVRQMVKEAIDMLAAVAPVEVVMVPGNHDRDTAFMLGEALVDWYWNTPDVTIDNSLPLRKYKRYGRCLIGFTHGDEEKRVMLPMLMASEAKQLWAETTFHEFHIGHTHRKKEEKFLPLDEINGVRLRVIPSLAEADYWHYRKGFVTGIRAAEGYLWHKTKGQVAVYSYNPST